MDAIACDMCHEYHLPRLCIDRPSRLVGEKGRPMKIPPTMQRCDLCERIHAPGPCARKSLDMIKKEAAKDGNKDGH